MDHVAAAKMAEVSNALRVEKIALRLEVGYQSPLWSHLCAVPFIDHSWKIVNGWLDFISSHGLHRQTVWDLALVAMREHPDGRRMLKHLGIATYTPGIEHA